MNITETIKYIGVNDHNIDLFEGQFPVPEGMSYNSYMILDEKIAILDSVDVHFTQEWLANIRETLGNRQPDYLIVQHMEPDHSGSIVDFLKVYPTAKIVASDKAFQVMKGFFHNNFPENQLVVGEGSVLSLGQHELTFLVAPMIHWPEVIMTYDKTDKILFSADGFGKFGALTSGNATLQLENIPPEEQEDVWACEARRYYFGIISKYGSQVQNLLKKAAKLGIQIICPLHGPALVGNIDYYLNLYNTWSSYRPEEEGVLLAYTSIYGNTKKAVILLADKLIARGCPNVVIQDLARCDVFEAIEDAFRYNKLVLATTTYNNDIFPFMQEFIHHLKVRNFQNRTVAFIENGSWGPMAAKIMHDQLAFCKQLTFAEHSVKIHSAVDEDSLKQIENLAAELQP